MAWGARNFSEWKIHLHATIVALDVDFLVRGAQVGFSFYVTFISIDVL